MPALPFDIVVFDLDGTLADTAPDLAGALAHMLSRLGRPELTLDAVRTMIGNGVRALVRRALRATGGADEILEEEGHALFLAHYGAHLCIGTKPYPGTEQALDALAESGAALAVCTNKPEAFARALIAQLGWESRFAAIVGGDSLAARKPDPAPLHEAIARAGGGRAVLVGDSVTDAATARAAGVPFVVVRFGYSDRPVEDLGADAVVDSFAGLTDALADL
ncbi:phosphoglycolate phosphatase [Sphingomonas parva]|uniref:Phosphoglycolate phosphatase n=2 Tax=Sphingomonas parva TaxID=2555898 RepID=A0A4Y8ZXL1_9SPHN|nr:phosphoglycolate phosphatase [Sphingomonas parva]